jgi:anaerobic selenocysteine-containing dehydrogenase
MQRAFQVIPPVGQAKSNWDVFCMLAKAMSFTDAIFSQTADDTIDLILSRQTPWLEGVDMATLRSGKPIELPLGAAYKTTYLTPSGKIEILNSAEDAPWPSYNRPHAREEGLFWLVTAPSIHTLNSSFNERPELVAKKNSMTLQMHPEDAAQKKLADGQRVIAFNNRGKVPFVLKVTQKVPKGVVVAEGVWRIKDAPGERTVNALTSQRLTDRASGATYYDTRVDVRAEERSK